MTRNSTPGGGSPLDEQIRRRREAQAEIQEQVLKRSLQRWERLALASAERSNAALTSICKDTERTLSDTASRMTAEVDRKLNRLRRRIWHPWLPALLGMVPTLAVQAAAMHWGWDLIRPQLERQALNRAGLTVTVNPDGSRWILFPEGTATWDPADRRRSRTSSPLHFLIPDRS